MELFLLRHGIPVEPRLWHSSDASRPLTPFGAEQVAQVIGKLIASGRLQADLIWASPYTRTQETAKIAAQLLKTSCLAVPGLSSGSDLISSLPAGQGPPANWPARLVLVGHQPDLGELLSTLTGDSHYGLGRSAVARLEGPFAQGAMQLKWLLSAEEILQLGS